MKTSPRRAIRYPELTGDAPDVPLWMERLALDLDDAPRDAQGTMAERPAADAVSAGSYFFASDGGPNASGGLYRSNAIVWTLIGTDLADGQVTTQKLAPGAATSSRIGQGAVETANLKDGATTAAKIADATIPAAKLTAGLRPSQGAGNAAEALRAIGTDPGQVASGTDGRLSDARTPKDGSVTPEKIATSGDFAFPSATVNGRRVQGVAQKVTTVPAAGTLPDGHRVRYVPPGLPATMPADSVLWTLELDRALADAGDPYPWRVVGDVCPLRSTRDDVGYALTGTSYHTGSRGGLLVVTGPGVWDTGFDLLFAPRQYVAGVHAVGTTPPPDAVAQCLYNWGVGGDIQGGLPAHGSWRLVTVAGTSTDGRSLRVYGKGQVGSVQHSVNNLTLDARPVRLGPT